MHGPPETSGGSWIDPTFSPHAICTLWLTQADGDGWSEKSGHEQQEMTDRENDFILRHLSYVVRFCLQDLVYSDFMTILNICPFRGIGLRHTVLHLKIKKILTYSHYCYISPTSWSYWGMLLQPLASNISLDFHVRILVSFYNYKHLREYYYEGSVEDSYHGWAASRIVEINRCQACQCVVLMSEVLMRYTSQRDPIKIFRGLVTTAMGPSVYATGFKSKPKFTRNMEIIYLLRQCFRMKFQATSFQSSDFHFNGLNWTKISPWLYASVQLTLIRSGRGSSGLTLKVEKIRKVYYYYY